MTLLERFNRYGISLSPVNVDSLYVNEVRRALAIAQAVEEMTTDRYYTVEWIKQRADELLEGK